MASADAESRRLASLPPELQMTLDQLAERIREVSAEPVVQGLANLLTDWKADDSSASELHDKVERYIGNSWIEKNEDHAKINALWSAFRDQAIVGIGGLTMNERLYLFGLFERFDAARGDEERATVYAKLHAVP